MLGVLRACDGWKFHHGAMRNGNESVVYPIVKFISKARIQSTTTEVLVKGPNERLMLRNNSGGLKTMRHAKETFSSFNRVQMVKARDLQME